MIFDDAFNFYLIIKKNILHLPIIQTNFMKTKILRDSLFVIALLFCGIAKSQDTLKVDEFRHIYNFKLGDPKSSFKKICTIGDREI